MALPSLRELPKPWEIEIKRQSIAMLRDDEPALTPWHAWLFYGLLAALLEVRWPRRE